MLLIYNWLVSGCTETLQTYYANFLLLSKFGGKRSLIGHDINTTWWF